MLNLCLTVYTQIKTLWWNNLRLSQKSLMLSDGGPSQSQAPDINQEYKLYMRVAIVSEAWPTVVQLKRKQ